VALTGVIVAAAYVALAMVSGHLSPAARGPLFDGGPGIPIYPWVSPPPELAVGNQPPTSATVSLKLGPAGSAALPGLETSDRIVTLLLEAGTVPPRGADTGVRIDIVAVDPATLGPLGDHLSAFGNAYRITGTYQPSGVAATTVHHSPDVVLVYPVTANLYAGTHDILFSTKGTNWQKLRTTSIPIQQEVEAVTPGFGYVVVAGVKGPNPVVPSPVNTGGTTSPFAIALMVGAGAALLVGLSLVLRNNRRA
jgi:hypothetical protein